MNHPGRDTHTIVFAIPVMQDWLVGKIAQWVHLKGGSDDPSQHEHSTTELRSVTLGQVRSG